jgi:nicotinamidase-related amidase
MTKALLVIDLQNDYFPGGKFPLWNSKAVLNHVEAAIAMARAKDIPVIYVQHIANPQQGPAPFFNKGTEGAAIHPRVLEAAPNAPVVVKEFADSFVNTTLEELLDEFDVDELLICGMMTQNCVNHTAISKPAEKYKVTILPDCCTTVDEMIHNLALHAVSTRVDLVPFQEAIR